ncbi:stage III sporulation protein AE [Blautia sp. MSK17_66]|uniref:stage III sporulation protein AE n=1 Tax=Blautia TaxID=572511 RepID=UPI0015711A9A|nr:MULTISPECIES: stage III sporulation protein AE [Blautia]MCB5548987.1 stage III sporulation protein AE [Blautia sp. MSK17_66]NSK00663.1 stage III sporulation protein AE [Blautia obeum]
MKRNIRIWFRRMFFVFVVMLWLETGGRQTVKAYGDSGEGLKDQKTVETQPSDTDELSLDETETAEELLKEINLADVQKMLDDFMGADSFSMKEVLIKLTRGERAFSKEAVQEFVYRFFFYQLDQEKELFVKLILLILLSAVFTSFAEVFENNQIGDISFFVVYLLFFTILMDSFSKMSSSLEKTISWMTEMMKGLAPAYYMTVCAASGAASAVVFYEGVLLMVWGIQWLLLTVLLPASGMYVLLQLVNSLSREEMLGKMAELLNTAVSWGLKSLLAAVVGLQIIRNLVAPVMDSVKRGLLSKAAGALPGVGNAVNMVTELVVTSAVLVRNCLGVVILVVFVLIGAGPMLHYGILSLLYRLLAAVAQPVSDRRMVRALGTMGEGCALLLRILFTAEVLCMLAFLVLMAGIQR